MKRQIIFRCVNAAFPRLYGLKFSFKLANISRSYAVHSCHIVVTYYLDFVLFFNAVIGLMLYVAVILSAGKRNEVSFVT